MRTIEPEAFKVYQLDELEPTARVNAIDAIAAKLGGEWWDSSDNEDITDVMVYTLAEQFGTPGHGDYGVGDFPGIDGVSPDGWDLERGSYLALHGTLTRENAPRLPWAPGLVEARLSSSHGNYTMISVETDEEELDPDSELDLTVLRERIRELVEGLEQAVEDAMHAAVKDGRAEMEYKTSTPRVEESILANEYEFLEDGTPYFG